MNNHLLNRDVQDFLDEHLNSDLDRMIFKGSPFPEIKVQELARQIQSKRKCKTKLPTWYETSGIFYPPKISIEQASSEKAAKYKASLVSGKSLADLSGGLGVDSYYFSMCFERVVYCEIDEDLMHTAKHNFGVLGADNISCVNEDSMKYLRKTNRTFDWIYLDPARRSSSKERVFLLEDCSPDILANLDQLFSKTDRLLLKLSPLLDISMALNQLKIVEEVHVLALDNEVKELLFLLNKESGSTPRIHAVNLKDHVREIFTAELNAKKAEANYGQVGSYLYEPNAAILKAGLFNDVSSEFKLTKLHPNSHLYSSDDLIPFPGRRFVVEKQMKYNPKRIKKEVGLTQAHVTTRNFHESVVAIRKRTGLKEGGDDYLFFTTDHMGQALVLVCTKAD